MRCDAMPISIRSGQGHRTGALASAPRSIVVGCRYLVCATLISIIWACYTLYNWARNRLHVLTVSDSILYDILVQMMDITFLVKFCFYVSRHVQLYGVSSSDGRGAG
ncbi:hypothetical protein BDW75DRAFT_24743 [Aspergillus navahoensis]